MAYLGLRCIGSFENLYYEVETCLNSDQSFKKKDYHLFIHSISSGYSMLGVWEGGVKHLGTRIGLPSFKPRLLTSLIYNFEQGYLVYLGLGFLICITGINNRICLKQSLLGSNEALHVMSVEERKGKQSMIQENEKGAKVILVA